MMEGQKRKDRRVKEEINNLIMWKLCLSLQLHFHADNGAGRVTAISQGAELCDGQWHSITAHKLKHRLELIVDGKKSEAASPDASSASADTSDPVYVGGYPGASLNQTVAK